MITKGNFLDGQLNEGHGFWLITRHTTEGFA